MTKAIDEDEGAPRSAGGNAPPAAHPPLSRRQITWIFVGLMLAMLLAAMDQTIVATALPTIVGDLHGLDHISWVITAYILAATIGLPIYGKAGDLFGRKSVFIFAIVVFLLGSILSGAAQDMTQLIAFRAIQGIGGGGLMIGVQAIVGEIVSPRERGRYMGIIGAVFGVASISGPLLGGVITDNWSWRWVFYINIPLGIVALLTVVAVLHLHKPTGPKPRLDYLGTVLLAAASAAVVLMTSWGGTTYDWNSPVIIGLGAITVLAAAGFVFAEKRATEPIIPLALFRIRNFTLTAVIGMTVGITMFSTIAYLPTFLQMVNGVSATQSGLMMLPLTAGMLTATITTGRLISTTGRYKLYPILGSFIIVIGLVLLSLITATSEYWFTGLGMLVMGLGIGCLMQNLVVIVQNSVPWRNLGTATSANNYFRQIGASFGIALFGAIFINRLTDQITSLHGAVPLGSAGVNSLSPATLKVLPPNVQVLIAQAFAHALPPIFLLGVPIIGVGLVMSFFIIQKPLSTTVGPGQEPESAENAGNGEHAMDEPEDARTDVEVPVPALTTANRRTDAGEYPAHGRHAAEAHGVHRAAPETSGVTGPSEATGASGA